MALPSAGFTISTPMILGALACIMIFTAIEIVVYYIYTSGEPPLMSADELKEMCETTGVQSAAEATDTSGAAFASALVYGICNRVVPLCTNEPDGAKCKKGQQILQAANAGR
jgi:hypothetical protein